MLVALREPVVRATRLGVTEFLRTIVLHSAKEGLTIAAGRLRQALSLAAGSAAIDPVGAGPDPRRSIGYLEMEHRHAS